jgi:hypothetical protein
MISYNGAYWYSQLQVLWIPLLIEACLDQRCHDGFKYKAFLL